MEFRPQRKSPIKMFLAIFLFLGQVISRCDLEEGCLTHQRETKAGAGYSRQTCPFDVQLQIKGKLIPKVHKLTYLLTDPSVRIMLFNPFLKLVPGFCLENKSFFLHHMHTSLLFDLVLEQRCQQNICNDNKNNVVEIKFKKTISDIFVFNTHYVAITNIRMATLSTFYLKFICK